MKIKSNQSGLAQVVVVALAVLVISVVGFAGWKVWATSKKDSERSKTETSATSSKPTPESTTPKLKTYKIPDGYTVYENKELGFKFSYPKVFGSFVEQPTSKGVRIYNSSEANESYGPGIYHYFTINSHLNVDQAIAARKYGPAVQFQNGKWITYETNPADVSNNKTGEEYKDSEGKNVTVKDNDGLKVYLFESIDEGTTFNKLVFVINNKLQIINLPYFSDGTYSAEQASPNDKSTYNDLQSKVFESIFKL